MGRMSMLGIALLALALPAHAANPLRELQSSRGGAIVDYERATAGDEEFARLAGAAPTVAVLVADGTPDEIGREVAAAYAEGLKTVFPGAALVASRGEAAAAGYVAEVGVATASVVVEGTEKVYGTRPTGTSCKVRPEGTVNCDDVGGAPIAVGTRAIAEVEKKVDVTIRFLRQEPDGTRAAVFEDAYSVRLPQEGCRNEVAAAATVATALGKAAGSDDPLNIRLHTTPRLLRCDRK